MRDRRRSARTRRVDRGARGVRIALCASAKRLKRSKDWRSPPGGWTWPTSSSTRASAPTGCTSSADDRRRAARVAVWLAWDCWAFRGENAVANGWLQRARRLLDGQPTAPSAPGSKCAKVRWRLLEEGDPDRAHAMAARGIRIARAVGNDRSRDARPRASRGWRSSRRARSPKACAASTKSTRRSSPAR